MAIIVQKYGGSSVSSPDKLGRVADRIVAARAAGDLPVVVVSALGKTTDALVALAAEVSTQSHRREMDMILTAGERVSMALLAMAVIDRGCEALSLTGSQAGIITNTDHSQARIIEVRPNRVREALAKGKVVIVGGFAGVSTAKEVTTLGRGGSDTTAIALAAALEATSCDIFSDVEGIFTADPRVVDDAQLIDQMSHGEILEMGLRGARVLAPEAIDYARRHGIDLRASSTFGAGRGTLVTQAPQPGRGRAVGVSADPDVLPCSFTGSETALAALLFTLEGNGLSWKEIQVEGPTSARQAELLLDTRNSPQASLILTEVAAALPEDSMLEWRDQMGTVTVVGEGLAERRACWEIARKSLDSLGVKTHSLRGSSWGITAEVPRDSLDDVVRSWHEAFPGLTK
jgi:aspartate kinase